jgi:NitT/TauT family transport system substrate-binding protein
MSLRDNFVTPWVRANGFGDVDMARLAKSIDQIALTYDFKNRPKAEDIFTNQYLPPAADRKLRRSRVPDAVQRVAMRRARDTT